MASSAPAHESPAGSHEPLQGIWGALGGQLDPRLAHFSCSYPAAPCYSLLHPPPFRHLPQQVPAPCELPGPPQLLWPAPLLCSPLLLPPPGPPEDPLRAKAGPPRESTAALKAWLGQHLKNPYPSKGEKVLLALVSRMSLTQVSTWFANARRRLKKENRACWAPRPPKTSSAQEQQEQPPPGEGSEGDAPAGVVSPGPAPPKARPVQGPRGAGRPAHPWTKAGQGPRGPATGAMGQGAVGAEPSPPKPKIWRVAELAAGPQSEEGAAL